jgi:hypothetical protein
MSRIFGVEKKMFSTPPLCFKKAQKLPLNARPCVPTTPKTGIFI